jgi:hypothetical protein
VFAGFDVRYIPTREGWLYLAAVLDVYSRAIVGCGMSHTLGGPLATDALAMAISQRGIPELVHSDRGSTYATSLDLDLIYSITWKSSTTASAATPPATTWLDWLSRHRPAPD